MYRRYDTKKKRNRDCRDGTYRFGAKKTNGNKGKHSFFDFTLYNPA
jgi:hypothetical protein